MKSINGIYHVEPDESDLFNKGSSFQGNYSERSIEQMAKGLTKEQFKRHCDHGLSMVNAAGELVSGSTLFDLYSQYCRGDT